MVQFGKYCFNVSPLSFVQRFTYHVCGHPHLAKCIQSNYFIRHIKKIIKKQMYSVMDVGCGNGDYAFYLAETYPWLKIDAIDTNKETIQHALAIQRTTKLKNIQFIVADVNTMKFGKKYDCIYSIDMLHAVEKKKEFLNCIARRLAKNGVFYIQDCRNIGYSKTILPFKTTPFNTYRTQFFKGQMLREEYICHILEKSNLRIIEKGLFFSALHQLAWEIDQFMQNTHYLRIGKIILPFLKIISTLGTIFPFGKKNEFFIIARKIT